MRTSPHDYRWGIGPHAGQAGTRFAGIAKSAQVRIRTSSRRRTYSIAPRDFSVDVPIQGVANAAQIEDGIADQLSGAVESDVPAAVAFEEFDSALAEHVRASENILLLWHCGPR